MSSSSTAAPVNLDARNQTRLVVAQIIAGTGVASGVAVGALLAEQVSGSTASAGFAQTAVVLGAGLLAVPLAKLAARRGRRSSLTLGFGLAAVGALLILIAVGTLQFWLLLLGMMCFGSGTATNLQSRYAATETAAPGRQARAMSIVLWATTVGSVVGPNLSGPGADLGEALGINRLSGPYLFSVIAFVLAALIVSTLRMGLPSSATETVKTVKVVGAFSALRRAMHHPNALFAVVAIVGGQMMMTSVMVMTPVTMVHHGMSLELVGIVISVHIIGMYAASPLFGVLADRVGPRKVALGGAGLFVVAFVLGAFDATAPHSNLVRLTLALAALGLGWSAAIIGGSTLLTQSVHTGSRVPLQGAVDALMNYGAALLAAIAGPVLAFGGFLAINVMAGAILVPFLFFGVRAIVKVSSDSPVLDIPEPFVERTGETRKEPADER